MKGGRIVEHGTYKDLLDRGVDFHAELGDGGQQTPQLSPAPSLTPANSMPGTDFSLIVLSIASATIYSLGAAVQLDESQLTAAPVGV